MTSPATAGRRSYAVVESPVGPLTLVAVDGALAGLYMDEQRHRPPPEVFGEPADDPQGLPFGEAARQLREYFDGERTAFDLPLALDGTEFQRRVWAQLRAIPYGQTVSYGQLADRLGQPSASRAVGLANGKNPVSIVVPCHRVVGTDGGLTGYGGGIERKRYLLDHERRVSAAGGTAPQGPPRHAAGHHLAARDHHRVLPEQGGI
jgi:methylated-DNA-[protein]-cysteine S-methyltransferase